MIDQQLLDRLTSEAETDGVQQLVVGGIVADGNNVLLLKRPALDFMGGIYELPSGKVDPDEALDAALVREVNEETGLEVSEIGDFLGSFDYTSGSGKKSRQFNFVVSVAATEPVTLTEHDEHAWAPVESELPVTDAVKQVFEAYRKAKQEPVDL